MSEQRLKNDPPGTASSGATMRADAKSPSDLSATGGRSFASSQLKAPVPDDVIRELVVLQTQDRALINSMLYRPRGRTPTTGVILMHPVGDFMQHYALGPLASTGYAALGLNSRFSDESNAIVELTVLDVAAGVKLLRDLGCERVALLGNSGGAGLMTFYQEQAEHATVTSTPAGDPPDLTSCELPTADALILLNAHPGRAQVLTRQLDPAVVDERDAVKTDPTLDMFNPDNGPPYSTDFIERYSAAQVARNERITVWAQARLSELSRAGFNDEAFVVHRTTAALQLLDQAIDPSDRPLGWFGEGDVQWYNRAAVGIARFTTCRSWLSQWGLSTSNALAQRSLAHTAVPLLVLQSTADQGVYPADAKGLHDAGGMTDKQLHWIEGGLHFFMGQPEIQAKLIALISGWLSARGMTPA